MVSTLLNPTAPVASYEADAIYLYLTSTVLVWTLRLQEYRAYWTECVFQRFELYGQLPADLSLLRLKLPCTLPTDEQVARIIGEFQLLPPAIGV